MTDDERIDKVLSAMKNSGNGTLDIQKYLVNVLHDTDLISHQRVRSFIVFNGYANPVSNTSLLKLLPPGLDVLKIGGYLKYLELIDEKEARERQWDITKEKLDEVNLKLNGFYLKYKWVPFVLSGLAILTSIAALIISLFTK
jgi:hypothetical protein